MAPNPGKYDVAAVYRIYPKVSKVPLGFPGDKLRLAELCLKSFRESLGDLRVKLYVLLDGCPPEYEALFKKYFRSEDLDLIHLPGIGNLATFEKQIEILSNQSDSEIVYFAEDDYSYLPNAFTKALEFLQENRDADFVSLYDHPDYYSLPLHQDACEVRWSGDRHWRTAPSTCLTFLTTRQTLRETARVLKTYCQGSTDASIWLNLTKYNLFRPVRILKWLFKDWDHFTIIARAWLHAWYQNLFGKRRKLWIPIPGLATHMESTGVAPGFDWKAKIAGEAHSLSSTSP